MKEIILFVGCQLGILPEWTPEGPRYTGTSVLTKHCMPELHCWLLPLFLKLHTDRKRLFISSMAQLYPNPLSIRWMPFPLSTEIKNIWSCNIRSGWSSLLILLFWKKLCFKFLEDTLISFLFLWQNPVTKSSLEEEKVYLFYTSSSQSITEGSWSGDLGDSKQEPWKKAASWLTNFVTGFHVQTRASHLPRGDSTHRALLHQVTKSQSTTDIPIGKSHWDTLLKGL